MIVEKVDTALVLEPVEPEFGAEVQAIQEIEEPTDDVIAQQAHQNQVVDAIDAVDAVVEFADEEVEPLINNLYPTELQAPFEESIIENGDD